MQTTKSFDLTLANGIVLRAKPFVSTGKHEKEFKTQSHRVGADGTSNWQFHIAFDDDQPMIRSTLSLHGRTLAELLTG